MAMKTRKPLKTACACGVKGYPSEATAERALDRIKARKLRDTMPKRVVQCWRGSGIWRVHGRFETGPDRDTRAVVVERDCWACACCGTPIDVGPYSMQHRVPRGGGGSSRPEINSPANLVTLCGSATSPGGCHIAAESRAQIDARSYGFWLRSG
jgi:hypothetical protein